MRELRNYVYIQQLTRRVITRCDLTSVDVRLHVRKLALFRAPRVSTLACFISSLIYKTHTHTQKHMRRREIKILALSSSVRRKKHVHAH